MWRVRVSWKASLIFPRKKNLSFIFLRRKMFFLRFFLISMDFLILEATEITVEKKTVSEWMSRGRKHVLLPNWAKLFTTATNRVAIAMAVTDLAAAVTAMSLLLLLLNLCYIICSLKRKMLVCMWRSIELRAHHIRCLKMILHVSAYGFLSFFHSFLFILSLFRERTACVCALRVLSIRWMCNTSPLPPTRFI